MGNKFLKDLGIGTLASIIGSFIWAFIALIKGHNITSITIGDIFQFMLDNIVPMIFMCIAVMAYLRAGKSTSQENINGLIGSINNIQHNINELQNDWNRIDNAISRAEQRCNTNIDAKINQLRNDLKDELQYIRLKLRVHINGAGIEWDYKHNSENINVKGMFTDEEKVFLKNYQSKFQ